MYSWLPSCSLLPCEEEPTQTGIAAVAAINESVFHWEVLVVNNKVIFKALKHCHWLFLCHFHFHHVAFSLV